MAQDMSKDDFLLLLSKKLTDRLDQQELLDYHIYLANHPEYQEIVTTLDDFFRAEQQPISDLEQELHLEKIYDRIGRPHRSKRGYKRVLQLTIGIAACLLLFFIWNNTRKQELDTIQPPITFQEISSPKKNYLVALEDGTTVILDQDATLFFNTAFGSKSRLARLEGNAQFDVATDAEMPMRIDLKNWDIVVKGTSFNIFQDKTSGHYELQLFEGKVEIASKNNARPLLLVKPKHKVKWTATSTQPHDFHMSKMTDDELYTKQQQYRDSLIFKNVAFKDLAAKIKDRYKKTLIFKNQNIARKRYTGIISNIRLEELLYVLSIGNSFNYEIRDSIVIIK